MPIGVGVYKKVSLKKQTAVKTIAPAGAGGTAQYQRRVTSTIDPKKATFQSAEILTSQQRRDFRHGVKSVAGSLSQELSVGGHQKQFEAVLRAAAVSPATTGAITNVTAAATTGAAGTFTRAAGSFLTDGFQIGDVINSTGWATTGVPNNNHYSVVTGVTALVLTVLMLDNVAVGPKASGDSVTIVEVGKKVFVPQSGHTRDYFTIEHWHSDIAQSEVFKDCVFTGANINVPPNGMATVEFPVMGLDAQFGTAEYFTTPATEPTGGITAGLNGALLVDGVSVANITSAVININGNYAVPGGVIGTDVDPDVFPGVLEVTGTVTVLFQDAVMRDKFWNEQVGSIVLVLVDGKTAAPGFTSIVMPKVKFGGADKSDGQQGISLTMPFTALENTAGGAALASLATTISIQDSAFA